MQGAGIGVRAAMISRKGEIRVRLDLVLQSTSGVALLTWATRVPRGQDTARLTDGRRASTIEIAPERRADAIEGALFMAPGVPEGVLTTFVGKPPFSPGGLAGKLAHGSRVGPK